VATHHDSRPRLERARLKFRHVTGLDSAGLGPILNLPQATLIGQSAAPERDLPCCPRVHVSVAISHAAQVAVSGQGRGGGAERCPSPL